MSRFIDFPTLERPSSPNTFLLAPDGLCRNANPDDGAPVYSAKPEALFDRVVGCLEQDRAIAIHAKDRDALRLHAVATTPLLRFKDDVDVAILPIDGAEPGATLAVYSRSRVGYSDFGANARRVRTLVKNLGDQ